MHHKMFNSDKVQFESSLSGKQPKIARSLFYRRAWSPCFRKKKSPFLENFRNFFEKLFGVKDFFRKFLFQKYLLK